MYASGTSQQYMNQYPDYLKSGQNTSTQNGIPNINLGAPGNLLGSTPQTYYQPRTQQTGGQTTTSSSFLGGGGASNQQATSYATQNGIAPPPGGSGFWAGGSGSSSGGGYYAPGEQIQPDGTIKYTDPVFYATSNYQAGSQSGPYASPPWMSPNSGYNDPSQIFGGFGGDGGYNFNLGGGQQQQQQNNTIADQAYDPYQDAGGVWSNALNRASGFNSSNPSMGVGYNYVPSFYYDGNGNRVDMGPYNQQSINALSDDEITQKLLAFGNSPLSQNDPRFLEYNQLLHESAKRQGAQNRADALNANNPQAGNNGSFQWPDFGDLFGGGTGNLPDLGGIFGGGDGTGGSGGGGFGGLTGVMSQQIPLDPIFSDDDINRMLNQSIGANETQYATNMENAREQFGSSGFSSSSPALRGMDARFDLNRAMANTAARRDIPIQAQQANASHQLQALGELAKQRGLDINSFAALINAQTGILNPLFGLLGSLI